MGERIDHQFRLKFREVTTGLVDERKVLSWSYYAGYLRGVANGLSDTEALDAVIAKVKKSIFDPGRSVYAIFGTHSRFGHWMISGLYHLPRSISQSRLLNL